MVFTSGLCTNTGTHQSRKRWKNVDRRIDTNVLPSLSRLMGSCIGAKTTREDHKSVSDQMYAAYAQGRELRGLVAIVGEDALNE